MHASFENHLLKFKIPAKTSRGSYTDKIVYVLTLTHEGRQVLAEASPLPDLSIDDMPLMEEKLQACCSYINEQKDLFEIFDALELKKFPSIQFAIESAFEGLKYKTPGIFFPSLFTDKKEGIPINGLIWMADITQMLEQITLKVEAGYQCIKLKIGALDFDAECRLLEQVRKIYSAHKITLRVDANGAFSSDDATQVLRDLKRFELHSIEQPIKAGQPDAMQKLCAETPIPIALDEELIGVDANLNAALIVKYIRPQYLILKPTLLGGYKNCNTWINAAHQFHIGWWITSALESNLGLSAIAQYCASLNVTLPQGLGTGALYQNNFQENTEIRKGILYFK